MEFPLEKVTIIMVYADLKAAREIHNNVLTGNQCKSSGMK